MPASPWCGESVTLTTVPPPAGRKARSAASRVIRSVAADVEPRHRAPALRLDRLGGREVLAAGVVDQRVEAAAALEREAHDPLGVGVLADVAGDVRAPSSAAVAASTSSRRPQITTSAPQRRSSAAAAFPRPVPPPVTSTTRPASDAVGEDLGAGHPAASLRMRVDSDAAGSGNNLFMQIPGVHIETLHNPTRYSYSQIEKACTLAALSEPREARARRAAARLVAATGWAGRRGPPSRPSRSACRSPPA